MRENGQRKNGTFKNLGCKHGPTCTGVSADVLTQLQTATLHAIARIAITMMGGRRGGCTAMIVAWL